ncbi:LPXTG cell wall anchor domain-containing protein [Clostridium sp. NSJ-6]|uniref:LPXTG cell wall anchor domain-containing protein n=1 Tax=Clostridium hominis TaxID=2763036 RepID=A0ABR7DI72_9CLOT|nr:LPXTG cell wall anchor domain-containing protein [Clostridium hominis]MBC5630543.1 LPXTG cell wall anchor domain-containing protein [Clostridium hominis]
MLGKKIKVLVSTLILLSIPISVMASPRAIINDSVIIDKGDGSVVIPPSEVLDEILNNETSLSNKGSITIKLADAKNNQSKEGVEFSISKIADIEDGLYKVKDDYKSVEVDLNNIKTANDLELAAELFKKVAKTDNLMKTNANGECNIEDLDVGVYLVYAKNIANYDNITPFIVSIPSWNEKDKSMSYDIQVIPKHTEIVKKEKSKVPATAYDGSSIYLALGSIGLIGSATLFFNARKKE